MFFVFLCYSLLLFSNWIFSFWSISWKYWTGFSIQIHIYNYLVLSNQHARDILHAMPCHPYHNILCKIRLGMFGVWSLIVLAKYCSNGHTIRMRSISYEINDRSNQMRSRYSVLSCCSPYIYGPMRAPSVCSTPTATIDNVMIKCTKLNHSIMVSVHMKW